MHHLNTSFKLSPSEKKIVGLASLGGMLEFYDFIIYGIFSVYFAPQFFPSNNTFLTIIKSSVVFVLGYLARPVGGIIFSHIGDEYGRKKVLIITIVLMGISSLGIGVLPTYAQIGIAAPIILLSLRLIQGLAIGGELPSTFVYISESLSHKQGSGFGITMTGVNCGLLLGMVFNQVLNHTLNATQLGAYGWRIPFIFGGVLCLISYKIRTTLQETSEFNQLHDRPYLPIAYLCKNYTPQLFSGIAITSIMSSLVVIALVFMPTYLHEFLYVNNLQISHLMPLVMLLNVITIFITGKFANKVSPAKILRNLLLACIILIPLSYLCIATTKLALGVIILGILEGVAAMIIPYLLTCLFPTKIRLTGIAMCYNIGFTIFGGLAPVIISGSIKTGAGIFQAPLIFMAIVLILCASGLFFARKHLAQ